MVQRRSSLPRRARHGNQQRAAPSFPSTHLTVSIPSPSTESFSPTSTASKDEAFLPSRKGTAAFGVEGANTQLGFDGSGRSLARVSSNERYKSLFTNAPAELPEVSVVPVSDSCRNPSGGEVGATSNANSDGPGSPVRTQATPERLPLSPPNAAWVKVVDEGDANTTGGDDTNQTYASPRRRAQTVKVDYHNTVQRKSGDTSFVHPVGHPNGISDLVQHSQSELLEGWKQDAKAVGERGMRGSVVTVARGRADVAAKVGSKATARNSGDNHGPMQSTRTRPLAVADGNAAQSGAWSLEKGGVRSLSEETSSKRLSRSRRGTAASAQSSGDTGGWAGIVYDKERSSSASTIGLPRQLSFGTGLEARIGREGKRDFGGNSVGADGAGLFEHSRRIAGGNTPGVGRSWGRNMQSREANNLHPAWHPKGLTRRQRAVSTLEREKVKTLTHTKNPVQGHE